MKKENCLNCNGVEEETYCHKHHNNRCDACEAIRESIRHWEVDIIQPLKEGRVIGIHFVNLVWMDTQEQVPCLSKDCPLCDAYLDYSSMKKCKHCPYFKHYGYLCDHHLGHWRAFKDDPNLKNAEEMKLALIELLS